MYEIEFLNGKTGEIYKETYEAIDWREAASHCFKLQHVLREKRGGNWTFFKLKMAG